LRQIVHVARHRAFDRQLMQPEFRARPARHPPLTRAQTEYIVPASRIAQAAHEIRTIRHRQQTMCECDRRTTTAAACAHAGVPRIASGAMNLVEGMRAQSQFRNIGLADDDRASRLDTLSDDLVVLWHYTLQQRASKVTRETNHMCSVFNRMRYAVQPAHGFTARQLCITCIRLFEQIFICSEMNQRVIAWIQTMNARQIGLHHLTTR
jgi:hypothetical protein